MNKVDARLQELFDIKHPPDCPIGWSPKLRQQFRYFTPDDYYEAAVDKLVDPNTEWLDVGGGDAIFPSNPNLAHMLADRCRNLVAVDPSDNIHSNIYAHERYQSFLEEFQDPRQFSLVTARMVVEHVSRPEEFVARLGKALRPGGKAVIYTVNRWAPLTVMSSHTSLGVHHAVKRLLWRTEEKDTFPVEYLMNTRSTLNSLFASAGFREVEFHRLDDCRTLARWKFTSLLEMAVWKALRMAGLGYPESCLLGVYERS